jgi:nucleoside 2-deoxyribosyltransferase
LRNTVANLEHFIQVAEHIFRPAVEAAGFEFRAPKSTSSEIIQAEIIENLTNADLVLCDISTLNANVFLELGIRIALNKPVAMVRDSHTTEIPFDTSMTNTHMYSGSLNVITVKKDITDLTTYIEVAKLQTQNAVWKHFGLTQRAQETDPGSPEDAKLDLILAEMKRTREELIVRTEVAAAE